MANGQEFYCVTCGNFDMVPKGTAERPVNVRDPAVHCICKLHRVHLPMSQTTLLLVCRDWTSKDGKNRLVEWRTQKQYDPGILYAYKSMYKPELQVVAELAELPPI